MARIRVVIPCRAGAGSIARCAAAVTRAEGVDPEIVVIDDGENGDLEHALAGMAVEIVKTRGGEGAAAARNLGASGFRGDVLVFVDADVEVERHAIARLVAPILTDRADATVGRYSPDVAGMPFAAAYKQRYLAYVYARDGGELQNTFWTALGAVRRTAFERAARFDERVAGAGPEDLLLGVRLTALGGRILSVPEAMGRHHAHFSLGSLAANDLRKGIEDIYVHWTRAVPLSDNRHVGALDVLSVAAAGLLVANVLVHLVAGGALAGILVASACHGGLRAGFWWRAYRPVGPHVSIPAAPTMLLLDVVRGVTVLVGSVLAATATCTGGRISPFERSRTATGGPS